MGGFAKYTTKIVKYNTIFFSQDDKIEYMTNC